MRHRRDRVGIRHRARPLHHERARRRGCGHARRRTARPAARARAASCTSIRSTTSPSSRSTASAARRCRSRRVLDPGSAAAVQGYPNGGPFTSVTATVLSVGTVPVPDVYDETAAPREIYALRRDVRPGNSGGPLLTGRRRGRRAGVRPGRDRLRRARLRDDGRTSSRRWSPARAGMEDAVSTGSLHAADDSRARRYAVPATQDRPNDPRGRASTASSSGTEGASLPANLSGPRTAWVRPLWKVIASRRIRRR